MSKVYDIRKSICNMMCSLASFDIRTYMIHFVDSNLQFKLNKKCSVSSEICRRAYKSALAVHALRNNLPTIHKLSSWHLYGLCSTKINVQEKSEAIFVFVTVCSYKE